MGDDRNRRRGWHEWGAVLLLAFGGLVFGIGWVGGIVLLWTSSAWSTTDKRVGTAVVGGWVLLAPFGLLVWAWYSSYEGWTLAFILAVAATVVPLVAAVYLAVRADANRPA